MNKSIISFLFFTFISTTSFTKTLKISYGKKISTSKEVKFNFKNKWTDYYQKLRKDYKIDDLVKDCKSDLDKALVIMDWVHNLWEHSSDSIPAYHDARFILNEVIKNKKRFRCVEYSTIISAALNALDIDCRKVCLKTADCQTREYGAGHVVNEVYIKDLKKWVMLDGQANVMPKLGKKPLNTLELQEAIYKKKRGLVLCSLNCSVTKKQYFDFIKNYLYYLDTSIDFYDPYFTGKRLMLVPLGAVKPTVFQKIHALKNLTYTDSLNDFYPAL